MLAFELTKMVHGKKRRKALDAAKALFVGGGSSENMPSTAIAEEDLYRRQNWCAGSAGETGLALQRPAGW